MHAVVITEPGEPEVLRWLEVPVSVMTTACIPSPFARLWPVSARWGGLLTLSFPGHLLDKVSAIATQCDHSGALGVEITRHLAYARRDAQTRRACAPTHDY